MKRILFVDDEKLILEGLQAALRQHRKKWTMVFALGAEQAIACLQNAPFDVVVTDMRMPGIDGAALLAEVKAHYPQTTRIVLSGYMELEAAFRAVPVAHQFLNKPCDPNVLEDIIERACLLDAWVPNDALRLLLGQIQALPSVPRVYGAIVSAMNDPDSCSQSIAKLLKQDVAICAKLLQLVNSAFFGLARRVTNIEDAVAYLGISVLKNLVLSVEVFQPQNDKHRGLFVEQLQRHSLLTAGIAQRLWAQKSKSRREDAFVAALLHDVGKLVLAKHYLDSDQPLDCSQCNNCCALRKVEQNLGGVTHADVGAYLLGLWGIPQSIVSAIACHHHPSRCSAVQDQELVTLVHLADALAHQYGDAALSEDTPLPETVDPMFFAALDTGSCPSSASAEERAAEDWSCKEKSYG